MEIEKIFQSIGTKMLMGASGDMIKIRIRQYNDDTPAAIDVDVCMKKSAVRKRTLEGRIIAKEVNWTGCTRQKIVNKRKSGHEYGIFCNTGIHQEWLRENASTRKMVCLLKKQCPRFECWIKPRCE